MIIRSKYENDVYQFNISYTLMMKFLNMKIRFKFKNRRAGEKFDQKFIEDIKLDAIKLDENSPLVPCVKVPDEPGKEMGDPKEVEYCKYVTGKL